MERVDCHPAVALEEVVGVGRVLLACCIFLIIYLLLIIIINKYTTLAHQAHDLRVARVDQLEAVRPLRHDVVVVVQQIPVQN